MTICMKKKWNLVLFSFLLFSKLSAQNSVLDSLHQAYVSGADEEQKIMALIELAYVYRNTKPDTTIVLGQLALKKSQSINFERGEAWALNRLGIGYFIQGKVSNVIENCQDAISLFKKNGDFDGLADTYNIIGYFYISQKQYEKSLEYLEKSHALFKKTNNKLKASRLLSNMGTAYYYSKNYKKALINFQKSLKEGQGVVTKADYAVALNNIGLCHVGLEEYEKGLKGLLKAYNLLKELKNDRQLCESAYWISDSYLKIKDYQNAKKYALEGLELSQNLPYLLNINRVSKVLVKVYAHEKNYQKAFEYQQIHQKSSDSLFNIERAKLIADFEASTELEKRDMEISKQKEINSIQRLINYLVLFSLLVALVLIYQIYKSRQKEIKAKALLSERNAQVQKQKEELEVQADYLAELNSTKDKLFAILGHDLRSPITTLKGWLTLLQKEAISPEEFIDVSKQLRNRVDHVYFALNNLLIWANSQMQGIKTIPEMTNLSIIVQENFELFSDLAKAKQIHLYNKLSSDVEVWADREQVNLVFRNLINNSLKFTQNQGSIHISGSLKEKQYEITIQDTGPGISQENQKKLFDKKTHFSTKGSNGEKGTGLGLILVKEMLGRNKGEIWVKSKPGQGASFCFTLPLKPNY